MDKLEIRVPARTMVGKLLEPVYNNLRRGLQVPGFTPSPYYHLKGDLRPFGISAIVHFECKRGKGPNHKLELLETGRAAFSTILSTIEQVFRFDPLTAEVMRVDLATDVEGISVASFEAAAYVQYKRSASDIGQIEYSRIGGREVETIYLGKRPNCFRIYNKTAEYLEQYRKLRRRCGDGSAPAFQILFGVNEDTVLTRLERQIAAGRVPAELGTVRAIRDRAADFNPFESLRLEPGSPRCPTPQEVGLTAYLEGMQLRYLARSMGMHRLRRFINQHSKGNAARMLNQFADFLTAGAQEQISTHDLTEGYQRSMRKQLAA